MTFSLYFFGCCILAGSGGALGWTVTNYLLAKVLK